MHRGRNRRRWFTTGTTVRFNRIVRRVIEHGDIVTEINGTAIDDRDGAVTLMNHLRKEPVLHLALRDLRGRPRTIAYVTPEEDLAR